MNELMTPFITKPGTINFASISNGEHKYEAFIEQDYSMNNNTKNLSEEERTFETTINIKVLGYLSGEGYSRKKPLLSRRENQVKVRFTNERRIVGDKIPWKKKDNDYNE